MKRPALIVLTLVALAISCTKNQKQQQSPSPAATLNVTLNGIDKATALKEIQYFGQQRFNDPKPANTTIWFDRAMVQQMVSLLQTEGADGIRIYFVSDPGATTVQSRNSIVLVSTHANGTNTAVPSGMRHQDYYEHPAANALFSNLKAINGVLTYGNESSNALLYKTCTTCQPERADNSVNLHQLSRQTAEQMVQGFGKHPISTISEWFDVGLFQAFTKDKNYDGLRIYFATKTAGSVQPGSDAFVIIKTVPGPASNSHVDYFGDSSASIRPYEVSDEGQDNGEECPRNCQL